MGLVATSHCVGVGAMPVPGSGMPVHWRSTGVPVPDNASNAANELSDVKPIAVRTGKFDDVMSTRTHSEAGMRATVEIK